jgi:hypothetical protein
VADAFARRFSVYGFVTAPLLAGEVAPIVT